MKMAMLVTGPTATTPEGQQNRGKCNQMKIVERQQPNCFSSKESITLLIELAHLSLERKLLTKTYT